MGCGSSSFEEVYPEEWITSFASLQLTKKDLVRLERVFAKIDVSADNRVDIMELLDYLDIPQTAFSQKVFSIFDEDDSANIDFREFVLSLWNFCSCTDSSLAMFAFDLYDTDASGKIEAHEIEHMLREVYGDSYDSNQHAGKLMQMINKQASAKHDNTISLETFARFSSDNPAMLFPAFEMQRRIQKVVLGVKFWQKHLDRRIELVNDGKTFVSVKQLLASRVNEQTFREMIERPLEDSADRAIQNNTSNNSTVMGRLALDASGVRGTRGSGSAAFAAANAKAKLSANRRASQTRRVSDIHNLGANHSKIKDGWERAR